MRGCRYSSAPDCSECGNLTCPYIDNPEGDDDDEDHHRKD